MSKDVALTAMDRALRLSEPSGVNHSTERYNRAFYETKFHDVDFHIIKFHLYNFLLSALSDEVEDAKSSEQLKKFSINLTVTVEGDKVTLCGGNQKLEITEELYEKWGVDLPEDEEIRKKYFGNGFHETLWYVVLLNILFTQCIKNDGFHATYEVGKHFEISAEELKNRLILFMKRARKSVLKGYEKLENEFANRHLVVRH